MIEAVTQAPDLLNMIGTIGYPMAIGVYLLVVQGKETRKNTEMLQKLCTLMELISKNVGKEQ